MDLGETRNDVDAAISALSSPEAVTLRFDTSIGNAVEVLRPAGADGKISVAIVTGLGRRRTERVPVSRIAANLRTGWWYPAGRKRTVAERPKQWPGIGDAVFVAGLREVVVEALRRAGRDFEADGVAESGPEADAVFAFLGRVVGEAEAVTVGRLVAGRSDA